MIKQPSSIQPSGTFNGVRFQLQRGCFESRRGGRRYRVPYEIVAPVRPEQGNGCVVFEPPHFSSGLLARDGVLGHELLFGNGFSHAAVGFSHFWRRALDPVLIDGQVAPPPQGPPDFPYWEAFTDPEILVDFALALRQRPLGNRFGKVYSIGFSDSAFYLNQILAGPRSEGLFDFSMPATRPPLAENERLPGRGRVMVLTTELESAVIEGDSPDYRWYDAGGCPHVPDTPFNREVLPDVAGSSPLDWGPFARALFLAGHRWVEDGIEPPPSLLFERTAGGEIRRDARGNALGGIRHPALELGEAHFIASEGITGRYENPQAIGNPDFFATFDDYAAAFRAAVVSLVESGFVLREDVSAFDLNRPGLTFTQAYDQANSPAEAAPLALAV